METILTETFSIIKVSLFWALALARRSDHFPGRGGLAKAQFTDPSGSNQLDDRSFGSQLRAAAR